MANQRAGKAASDIPALKPYRGKPAVRNFREGDGNRGIIRSPQSAIVLPDSPDVGSFVGLGTIDGDIVWNPLDLNATDYRTQPDISGGIPVHSSNTGSRVGYVSISDQLG